MSIHLPFSNAAETTRLEEARQQAEAGLEVVDLHIVKPEEMALQMAPGDFALKNQVLPLAMDGDVLVVALGSIEGLQAVDDLGVLVHRPVRPVLADPALIREKIEEFFLEKILEGLPSDES